MMCSKFSPADEPGSLGSNASNSGASLVFSSRSTPLRIPGELELSRKSTDKSPATIFVLLSSSPDWPSAARQNAGLSTLQTAAAATNARARTAVNTPADCRCVARSRSLPNEPRSLVGIVYSP